MAQAPRKTRKQKETTNAPQNIQRKADKWSTENGINNIHLTDSQKELANKINSNIITFVDSPAGTGKSLAVLHTFVKEYLRDPTKRIIVIRTPVEASGLDKVGFLPDDLSKKLEPHFASTRHLLEQLLNKGKVETDIDHRIFFKVPNFELGATWDNSLVLIDEAQQMQPMILKLLLERIGLNSKVAVVGDGSQLYATNASQRNALKDAWSKFFNNEDNPKYQDIICHRFTVDDVMRSDIVKSVIRAYRV